MERVNSIATKLIATAVTDAAMEKVTGLRMRCGLTGPKVTQTNPNAHLRLGKALKTVGVDEVGALIPQAKDQKAFLRALPGIVGEAALTQTLSAVVESALAKELPSPRAIGQSIAADAVKNTVFYGGKARTEMPRPLGNTLWGFAAGATSEIVEAAIAGRTAQPLKRGAQTAAAKLIYGEVKALLENGSLL